MMIYGVKKSTRCPGLRFTCDTAECLVIETCETWKVPEDEVSKSFGIGAGCCIKAHYIHNGIDYDFASLPEAVKVESVRQIRKSYGI